MSSSPEPAAGPAWQVIDDGRRQQVLLLYLDGSDLSCRVVAWSFHDGSGRNVELPIPDGADSPYPTGVDALVHGWRLLQLSQLVPPYPGAEDLTSYLRHELVLERWVQPVARV